MGFFKDMFSQYAWMPDDPENYTLENPIPPGLTAAHRPPPRPEASQKKVVDKKDSTSHNVSMMKKAEMLGKAISIAGQAFESKFDKAGKPYMLHCLYVMYRVRDKFESDIELQAIAVLHDLVEDTEWTLDDLRKEGFSERVVAGVGMLTHDPDVDYMEYIMHLSHSEDARQVKMADLRHNSKITRMKGLTKKDLARLEKYHWAFRHLSDVKLGVDGSS